MRFSRRSSRRASRRFNERFDLVDVQFALQSLEDPSMYVASEDTGDVNEAEDEQTGLQFTDSMDENRVLLFPTHEEAVSFIEDNDASEAVKIVTVQVVPDEEAGADDATEAVQESFNRRLRRMAESYRARRAPRSLREGREMRRGTTRFARRGYRR